MKNNSENQKKYSWYKLVILVFISSFLFILANPNFIIKKGLGFLAWIYYLPVLVLISRVNLKQSWYYGFLYGIFSYGVYAYWLCNSYIAGYFLIVFYFSFLLALLFVLLKVIDIYFPKEAWIVQCLLICVYEYLRTLGFLGFSYGITAYTQWNYKIIIQICDIVGVFGLNTLIIYSSGLIYSYGKKHLMKRKMLFQKDFHHNNIKRYIEFENKKRESSLIITGIVTILFVAFVIFDFTYGFIKLRNHKEYETMKICAVQSFDDPKATGIDAYNLNVKMLQKLTDEAIELYPNIEMVIWPETAVVPAIVFNYEHKKGDERYELSKNLLRYINSKNMQFVIGNGHKIKGKNSETKLYNAALIFNPGENVLPPEPLFYAKNHLVPFTENFPFKKRFSFIYKQLLKNGYIIWNPGTEVKVFENNELKFSTPICFEDTFGNVCRRMVLNGSRAFINLTNDAWANSEACQNQHLAMGIIRSVENRVPTVRCTNSGQTCIINTKGCITNQIDSFTSTYMIGDLEIIDKDYKQTIYNKIGDVIGITLFIILLFVLLMKIILVKIK